MFNRTVFGISVTSIVVGIAVVGVGYLTYFHFGQAIKQYAQRLSGKVVDIFTTQAA